MFNKHFFNTKLHSKCALAAERQTKAMLQCVKNLQTGSSAAMECSRETRSHSHGGGNEDLRMDMSIWEGNEERWEENGTTRTLRSMHVRK